MSVTLTLEHNGTKYSAEINIIKSTRLGTEDHGIFTAMLMCEGAGTGVGVGGYSLDTPAPERKPGSSRVGTAFGMEWLMRVMRIVGVESWEKLPGQRVLILFPETSSHLGLSPVGIANIDTGKALIFSELANEFFPEREAS